MIVLRFVLPVPFPLAVLASLVFVGATGKWEILIITGGMLLMHLYVVSQFWREVLTTLKEVRRVV